MDVVLGAEARAGGEEWNEWVWVCGTFESWRPLPAVQGGSCGMGERSEWEESWVMRRWAEGSTWY